MSKRKNARSDIFLNNEPCLQKKRFSITLDGLMEMLHEFGYIIGSGNNANEIEVDQAIFLRDLRRELSLESTCSTFLDALEKLSEDEIRFKWSLLPTVTSISSRCARNECQDSLFNLLLGIETIQERVSKMLLEKLAEFALCESNEIFHAAEGKSLACLILLQFRWLNQFVNSADFSIQLLDLIQVTPVDVQKDIISLLPTILPESNHPNIANNLTKILHENQELNIVILNTLVNLTIDSETLEIVRKEVLKTLSTAKLEDLPGIIRFVLTNLKPSDMAETIMGLRSNLEFSLPFDPIASSTPIFHLDELKKGNNGLLIMNAITLLLQFQKQLCDAWLKVLDKIHGSEKYKPFDLFVLLLLHPFPVYQKKVEALIRRKIKTGELGEDLLGETFRNHHQSLKDFMPTLFKIASVLIKSTDTSVSAFAALVFLKAFQLYDVFIKQEIVGTLVTHISNGTFTETNAALSCLFSLVKLHASQTTSFNIFIKSLIDYFDCLSLCQIRIIYEILSYLSYRGQHKDGALEDDMLIIISKQLSHKNLRYRKMGIIGALVAVKTVNNNTGIGETLEFLTDSEVSERFEKAAYLLRLVHKSVSDFPEAEALFYDELGRIISEDHFANSIEEWVDVHILSNFEQNFIVDVPPDRQLPQFNGADLKFGLDDEPVALNLFAVMKYNMREANSVCQLLCGDQKTNEMHKQGKSGTGFNTILKRFDHTLNFCVGQSSKPRQVSFLVLMPMYRLLCIRRYKQDCCLTAIDALLGCPILVPELQYRKFSLLLPRRKQNTLDIIFMVINWLRETINAFSSVDDNETRLNVIFRVQLIIKLQELLLMYLPSVESYVPPLAYFDCEDFETPCFKTSQKKQTKKKVPQKGKKMKKAEDTINSTIVETERSPTEIIESDSDTSDTKVSISMKNTLQLYFRELNLSVFQLLQMGITFKKPGNIFLNEKQRDAALHPNELQFFLEDLLSKLKHSYSFQSRFKSSKRQVGFTNLDFLKDKEKLIKVCISVTPSFCHLLENCVNYIREITVNNDEIIDPLALLSDESKQVSSCMLLLFKVLNCFFSWKGFLLRENLSKFKDVLRVFASREMSLMEDCPLNDLLILTIQCLLKFSDSIKSLLCASSLVELLEVIASHFSENKPRKQISELAGNFLRTTWLDLDKKAISSSEANASIQHILEVYLKHSSDVLQSLEYLSNEAVPKFLNNEEECGEDATFSTLNKSTLPSYCKVMLSNLINERKCSCTMKRCQYEDLQPWIRAIKIFNVLINLIKIHDTRSVIHASLLYGRQFLNIFLKHGMPLLDKYLASNKDEIISLLKNFQTSTRYMHHVCSHSKVLKDVSLTNQVPYVKKMLEHFIYRVKIMLAVNKCEEAFWIGNLKNRDLKGTEILSQVINSDSEPDQLSEISEDSDGASTVLMASQNSENEED